jgi:hypothetical protein
LVGQFDNEVLFPDIYARSGKWFHEERELFRRNISDETLEEKAQ